MSLHLKNYIDLFLDKKITAREFTDEYISKWRQERNAHLLGKDDDKLSELLSSTFCLADMYNPDEDREEYELDENKLRDELGKLMYEYLK